MDKTYKELLKDPLWVKKAHEIRHLDDCECIDCGVQYIGNEDKLDVHHTYYDFSKNIYDYDNKNLITLCHNCHTKEHEYGKKLNGKLAEYLRCLKKEGLLESQIYDLLEGLIEFSKNGETLDMIGNLIPLNRYNYGRIKSRDLRHIRVKAEEDELLKWKEICNFYNITFDKDKIESSEYQDMWNGYNEKKDESY